MKRLFHIAIAFFLVITTTGSIWVHLLKNIDDPVEVTSSESATEGEKDSKKEIDEWDDPLFSTVDEFIHELHSEWVKEGSSSYLFEGSIPTKLYLRYKQLRLDC